MTQIQQTEAACLLQSGALYRSRVGLVPTSDRAELVFTGFKTGAFSIYFGDAPIYHFDLEGRWQRAYIEPTHFLKGLDGRVHAIDRVREGANLVLKRRILSQQEVAELDLQVREVALDLIRELDAGRLDRQDPPADKAQPLAIGPLRDFLTRIAAWDAAAWDAHRARYQAIYGPLPWLPPDSQNAVVLQATLGDARGVRFGLGQASAHAVRSPVEFADHVRAVSELNGRRLLQSRVVFLAGSDVLRLPIEDVNSYLEIIAQTFSIGPRIKGQGNRPDENTPRLEGIHAFLDDFGTLGPDREAPRGYRQRNLLHVSLGVESGDPDIRARYGKAWSDDDLRTLVADLRAAAINLSILTLVGAGGTERSDKHLSETTRLLLGLGLDRGDTVFLLDERELRDPASPDEGNPPSSRPGFPVGSAVRTDPQPMPTVRTAEPTGAMQEAKESVYTCLDGDAWAAQQERLKQALSPLRERGVKVLPYSLEKQWG
ncbi:MAG: hypothetical protein ACP5XB_26750 [Isosphaeraceae bacterium]